MSGVSRAACPQCWGRCRGTRTPTWAGRCGGARRPPRPSRAILLVNVLLGANVVTLSACWRSRRSDTSDVKMVHNYDHAHPNTEMSSRAVTSSSRRVLPYYTIIPIHSIATNMVRCASRVSHDTCKYVLPVSSFSAGSAGAAAVDVPPPPRRAQSGVAALGVPPQPPRAHPQPAPVVPRLAG